MEFIHPHKAGKILGVIHEPQPTIHPIDLVRAATPSARPSTYLPEPFFALPVLMQGFTSQCGGYSLAQLITYLKAANDPKLSGSFDYAFEKTVDGYPNQDGTTISAIGKAGNLTGSCLDSLFPDDGMLSTSPQAIVTTPWASANQQARQDALSRLLGQPFLLTDLSIDGIHQASYENQAVILEVELGSEWYTAPNGAESWAAADVLPIRPPKTVIDSHFILVAPYDEPNDRTWFCNSWSATWAQNGFGYFNSNYAPFIKAGVAFRTVPPSVATVLNNEALPTPQKQQIIQTILEDIEQALGLIRHEIGSSPVKVGKQDL